MELGSDFALGLDMECLSAFTCPFQSFLQSHIQRTGGGLAFDDQMLWQCCAGYDEEARYFDTGVKQAKQAELLQKLHETFFPAFKAQLSYLHQATVAAFQQSLKASLAANPRSFAASAARC